MSLVALVALPAYYGRKVTAVQSRIADVLEPAARHSSNLSFLKSRQMARMEGFLLTGDRAAFREPYIAAIAEEDSVFQSLSVLARDLGVEVFERVARLVSESARWDFENQQIFDSGPDEAARASTRQRYDGLRQATRELNRAIESEVAGGRRDMANTRTRQNRLTFGLALIALCATLIVGRVGYRYRDLTIEREVRRREAVRARREIDSLLEATGDGVLGIDLEGKCTSLNRVGAELLGYTEREIVGRNVHDALCHSLPDGSPNPRGGSPVLRRSSPARRSTLRRVTFSGAESGSRFPPAGR